MATYFVTTDNWNDAGFWNGLSESSEGHILDFSGLPESYTVEFSPDGAFLVLSNGTELYTIGESSASGWANVYLGDPTDYSYFEMISGGAGDDTLQGRDTADTLEGAGGDDSLLGAGGDDSITGGHGHDTVRGGTGDDTIAGGDGDDLVYGNEGGDSMTGGAGRDSIYGEFGNDYRPVQPNAPVEGGLGRQRPPVHAPA